MAQDTKKKRKPYIVEEIPISLIDVSQQLIRREPTDDEIGNLAQNITAVELLQVPGVTRGENGRFTLQWGRRRLEAFRRNREETIPCHIYDGPVKEAKLLALVENSQRRQNSIEEECTCVDTLHHERNLSIDQICNALGRTRTWVLQRLAIPNFPPDCREALLEGSISLGAAEEIATIENESDRRYILNQAIHSKSPISEVRALVQIAKTTPLQVDAVQAGIEVAREQYTPAAMMMKCAACDQPTELSNLTIVRVHKNGCPSIPTRTASESEELTEEAHYARQEH